MRNEDGRWSKPLFHEEGTARSGLLLGLEAYNFADTYDADKGRMTCDPGTDPSGRLVLELLAHLRADADGRADDHRRSLPAE